MKEAAITAAIRKRIRELGGMSLKMHGGPYMEAGIPDLIVILDARVYFFEVKAEHGILSRAQAEMHDRLRSNGAHVAVVRSVEEAIDECRK